MAITSPTKSKAYPVSNFPKQLKVSVLHGEFLKYVSNNSAEVDTLPESLLLISTL